MQIKKLKVENTLGKLYFPHYLKMNWKKIENVLGETLPQCIKAILSSCGYDTLISLKCISEQSLSEIESHINTNARSIINALNCCHSEHYKNISEFKLIPGTVLHVDKKCVDCV